MARQGAADATGDWQRAAIASMPVVFVLMWSTGFIVARLAAPHAPPLTFLLWRFACVVAVLLPFIWLTAAPWPREPRVWLHTAVVGVLLQATYLGGVWYAISIGMPAGVSALIVGMQPLMTAFISRGAGERLVPTQWLGLVLGLIGLILVLFDSLRFTAVPTAALVLNIVALLGITLGTLYQKRFGTGVDLRTGSVIQFAASFIVLLPFAWALESMQVQPVAEFWVALLWSVFGLSLVAISLLLLMIRRGRATEVASLMYLTPPMTALLAWLIFDERLQLWAWLGIGVAVAGVMLVLRRRLPGEGR